MSTEEITYADGPSVLDQFFETSDNPQQLKHQTIFALGSILAAHCKQQNMEISKRLCTEIAPQKFKLILPTTPTWAVLDGSPLTRDLLLYINPKTNHFELAQEFSTNKHLIIIGDYTQIIYLLVTAGIGCGLFPENLFTEPPIELYRTISKVSEQLNLHKA